MMLPEEFIADRLTIKVQLPQRFLSLAAELLIGRVDTLQLLLALFNITVQRCHLHHFQTSSKWNIFYQLDDQMIAKPVSHNLWQLGSICVPYLWQGLIFVRPLLVICSAAFPTAFCHFEAVHSQQLPADIVGTQAQRPDSVPGVKEVLLPGR